MNTTLANIPIAHQWLKKLLTMVLLVACLLRFSGFDNGFERDHIAKGHQKHFSAHKNNTHSIFSDFVADDEEADGDDDDEISFHFFHFAHFRSYKSTLFCIASLETKLYKPTFYRTLLHIPLFLRNRNIRI